MGGYNRKYIATFQELLSIFSDKCLNHEILYNIYRHEVNLMTLTSFTSDLCVITFRSIIQIDGEIIILYKELLKTHLTFQWKEHKSYYQNATGALFHNAKLQSDLCMFGSGQQQVTTPLMSLQSIKHSINPYIHPYIHSEAICCLERQESN